MKIDYIICEKCDTLLKPLWSRGFNKEKTTKYICPECSNKIIIKEIIGDDDFCKNHCDIYGLQKRDKLK